MAERDSQKNQQTKMKKASDAINTDKDFGNDLAETKYNEKKSRKSDWFIKSFYKSLGSLNLNESKLFSARTNCWSSSRLTKHLISK